MLKRLLSQRQNLFFGRMAFYSQEQFPRAPSFQSSYGNQTQQYAAPSFPTQPSTQASPASTSAVASAVKFELSPFGEEVIESIDEFISNAKEAFSPEVQAVLHERIQPTDIQVKPDGVLYLPEVKYRQILTKAFGAGGWSVLPRSFHSLQGRTLSREYALIALGRFVSSARGHSTIQSHSNPAASSEAVKSNAIMRMCKDLGVASELWDSKFIAEYKEQFMASKKDQNGKLVYFKKPTDEE